jgi:hypothetical protein
MTSDPLLSLLLRSSTPKPPAEDSMLGMQIRRADKQTAPARTEKRSSHPGGKCVSGHSCAPLAIVLGSAMIVCAYLLAHPTTLASIGANEFTQFIKANPLIFWVGIGAELAMIIGLVSRLLIERGRVRQHG